GLCLFNEFKRIAEVASPTDIVYQSDIDDFVAYEKVNFGKDLTKARRERFSSCSCTSMATVNVTST
ncbi:hypothetical protein L916_21749, partial [Phytophthora nicotianae]